MKTIALIFGSTDSEHDISIRSARTVFENFPRDKYNLLNIYITRDGIWQTGNYELSNFDTSDFPKEKEFYFRFSEKDKGLYDLETHKTVDIDGAFLMLHGPIGEGGSIQGLLELANIPFVGSKMTSSAICMDKAFTHQIVEKEGIKMAKYQLLETMEDLEESLIDYPVVVKPSREGSSFGISYVENKEELIKALEFAFTFDSRVLIEEYIEHQELSVAVLKTKNEKIVSRPGQLTRFKTIADFDAKYEAAEHEILLDLPYSKEVLDQVVEESSFIFDILDCDHLARIDYFITKDEEIYFNEINTIPGFTSMSLYPLIMDNEGYDLKTVILKFIEDII